MPSADSRYLFMIDELCLHLTYWKYTSSYITSILSRMSEIHMHLPHFGDFTDNTVNSNTLVYLAVWLRLNLKHNYVQLLLAQFFKKKWSKNTIQSEYVSRFEDFSSISFISSKVILKSFLIIIFLLIDSKFLTVSISTVLNSLQIPLKTTAEVQKLQLFTNEITDPPKTKFVLSKKEPQNSLTGPHFERHQYKNRHLANSKIVQRCWIHWPNATRDLRAHHYLRCHFCWNSPHYTHPFRRGKLWILFIMATWTTPRRVWMKVGCAFEPPRS